MPALVTRRVGSRVGVVTDDGDTRVAGPSPDNDELELGPILGPKAMPGPKTDDRVVLFLGTQLAALVNRPEW